MNKQKQGFTLVELIVVITILTILGTIAFISLNGYSKVTRDSVRISDLGAIKKILSLYKIEKGEFPEVTDGVDVTYSGGVIWTEGVYGKLTHGLIGRLSNIPIDPLTETNYAYSVLSTKQEYQLASIVEGDEVSYISKSYAALDKYKAYVVGNFNGKVAKVNTGGYIYYLSVPSLITTDKNYTVYENIVTDKKNVYNGMNNNVYTYSGKNIELNGEIGVMLNQDDFVLLEKPVSEGNDFRTDELVTVGKKIHKSYSGTILETKNGISEIIGVDVSDDDNAGVLGAKILNFALGISGNKNAITYKSGPSCANPDDIIHDGSLVEGSPVEYNTAWQKINSGDPCYFTCEDEWKGDLCDIEKEWFDYDSNCNQSDIKITVLDGTEQIWAGCNSTLGTGTGFYEGEYADSDDSRACKNYDGDVTDDDRLKCFSETDFTKKEIDYFDIVQSDGENRNGDKGFDTIWGKMYLWSDLDNNCVNPSDGDFHGADNDHCACLNGWHVPTYSEYKDLLDKIADNNKEQTDWTYIGWKYNNGKVDSNHSGAIDSNFVSLLKVPLSGYTRESDGAGLNRGQYFHLLTANDENSSIYSHDNQEGITKSDDKDDYYSVRCIKD